MSEHSLKLQTDVSGLICLLQSVDSKHLLVDIGLLFSKGRSTVLSKRAVHLPGVGARFAQEPSLSDDVL